jgi:hypothetical protein
MHSHQEWEIFEDGRATSKRRVRENLMGQEHNYVVVHSMSPLEVIASTKNRLEAAFGELGAVDRAFHGYIPSDATEPLWDVLEGTTVTMKLGESVEVIDGHETYVLEIETANLGHYALWIDYNCGFNLRRYVVRRTGSDLVNGKRLDTPMRSPGRDVPLIRRLPRTKLVIVLDSVKIENIDGIFVPVEGRVRINTVRSNGEEETSVDTFKRSEIDLNPDFDKYEGAFVLDVPDGTPVNYVDFYGTGVRYVWQNGKMVPDVDDP